MAYPSYDEIAKTLGIDRCRGIRATGQLCREYDHRKGAAGEDLIHWADRGRIERAGVRRFLGLAARYQLRDEPRVWARIYLSQAQINAWGSKIGISFPSHLSQFDRLMVKAMLVQVPTSEPLREEAMRWAQQNGDRR